MAKRSCTPALSRRALLAASVATPASAALLTSPARANASDEAEFARRLALFHRRLAEQEAAERPANAAEKAVMEARKVAQAAADAEPYPAAAMVWAPSEVLTNRAGDDVRLIFTGAFVRAHRRSALMFLAHEDPTQQHRLAAWDAWEARRAAHFDAPQLEAAERRHGVLERWWLRARRGTENALTAVLIYPTASPAALRTKLDLCEQHDREGGLPQVVTSFCRLLGLDGYRDGYL